MAPCGRLTHHVANPIRIVNCTVICGLWCAMQRQYRNLGHDRSGVDTPSTIHSSCLSRSSTDTSHRNVAVIEYLFSPRYLFHGHLKFAEPRLVLLDPVAALANLCLSHGASRESLIRSRRSSTSK